MQSADRDLPGFSEPILRAQAAAIRLGGKGAGLGQQEREVTELVFLPFHTPSDAGTQLAGQCAGCQRPAAEQSGRAAKRRAHC